MMRLALLLALALSACEPVPQPPTNSSTTTTPSTSVIATSPTTTTTLEPDVLRRASVVTALTDGDTLVLDSKTKVRLIGVDTPETVKPNWPVECYGPEASKRLVQLAPKGAVVNAVLDPRNGTKPDRYGRQLLYLYGLDGTFINLQLVREGYGKADPYPNTREHAAEFAAAEKEAQAKGLGLWGHPDTKECRQK